MTVKYVNKNDCDKGLTLGKEYEVVNCVVHGWSTDVILINDNGEEKWYNSVMFDDNFQNELQEAIEELRDEKYEVGDWYDIYIKDFS